MKPTHIRARKSRLLLVEDHPVTREGLAQLLNLEDDLCVCGLVGTADEAMRAVDWMKPDLVVAGISLAGRSGLELIRDLASCRPCLPVLVLSTHDETLYAERAVRAGAKGYVMKSEPTETILAAIRQVLDGKLHLSEAMKQHVFDRTAIHHSSVATPDIDLLSDRELEVFRLIGQGRTTAQIAATLQVSSSTVATHRFHIQKKLGLKSFTEVVSRAAEWRESHASHLQADKNHR